MSKRKIAQKTTLTSLAAMMAAAPIIASPAANAAEIPVEITSVTIPSNPDVNDDGVLGSTEVANVVVNFKIPGAAKGGDTFVANVSEGYKPSIGSPINIPSASDPNTIIGVATYVSDDQFIVTLTDAVNEMVPGSVSGSIGLSLLGDLNDQVEFYGPTSYPIAINGVDSGHSYIIPGRDQPEYNQAPIYSFLAGGVDSLGPVGTLGYLSNSGAGTYFFEFKPTDLNMWEFATTGDLIAVVSMDNDVNDASNPAAPTTNAWEWNITDQASVVVQEADRVVIRVDNVPDDTAVRVQMKNAAGVVLQTGNELYKQEVKVVKADSLDAANTAFETARSVAGQTQLKSATGAATGENYTYTANLVASVKAADGSFQNANDAASSVEVDKGATEVGRDFQLRSKNTGTGVLKNPSVYLNGELVETVTTTVAAGDTFAYDTTKIVPIGAQTQNWEIRYENGPTVTDPTKTDTTFKKVPAIGLKALLGDADANTTAAAVVYTVTGANGQATGELNIQIPNPGDLPIVNPTVTTDTGFSKVLEGVTIEPGKTYTGKLTDVKLGVGAHTIKVTVTDKANGTSATDPVVAIVYGLPVAQADALKLGFNGSGSVALNTNDSAIGEGNQILPAKTVFADGSKSKTVDGVKFTIENGVLKVDASGSNNAGTYTFDYKAQDANGYETTAKATVTIAEPTIQVGFKALIAGQDANEPVVLEPGQHEVTFEVSNPNAYALGAEDIAFKADALGTGRDGDFELTDFAQIPADFTVAPGATKSFTAVVDLPKQGEVQVSAAVVASYDYTLNGKAKTITATAGDPAAAQALTGAITTAPDETRVRVGETTIIKYLENDATDPEGHPLDPATAKFTAGEGWTANEDGTFTREDGLTVKNLGNGELEVTGGSTEGTFEGLSYTVENTLGDVSEATGVSIEVYDFHVDLEALIGEDQQDADGTEDAFKVTIGHDEETTVQKITLPVTNTGVDPITVTGFQQVNTSDGGDGFEITLDEPVTLAPGESFTYTYDIELPVGEHVIDYKVLTAEGAVDTDPVVVVVDQEEAPAPAPTPETPVVEQEKPKAPTPVVPETGIKGATVEAKTADELAGSTLVASTAQDQAAGSAAGVLGALAAGVLALWGALTFRNRKTKDA